MVGAASAPDAPVLVGSEQILEGTGWGQPEPVSDWGGEGGTAFTYSQDLREQQWRGGGSWEEEEEQGGASGGRPQAWTTRSNYDPSGGSGGASSSGREFFAEAGPRGGGGGGGGGEDGEATPGQERPPYGAELLPSDIVILSRRDMVRVHP